MYENVEQTESPTGTIVQRVQDAARRRRDCILARASDAEMGSRCLRTTIRLLSCPQPPLPMPIIACVWSGARLPANAHAPDQRPTDSERGGWPTSRPWRSAGGVHSSVQSRSRVRLMSNRAKESTSQRPFTDRALSAARRTFSRPLLTSVDVSLARPRPKSIPSWRVRRRARRRET